MIYGITLILLSLIAVPSLLLSRKPNAAELLDKVAPYQGWIGLAFAFFGVWGVISAFLNMGWLASAPVWWATLLAGSVVEAGLGFLLGFPLINELFLSGNAEAQGKAVALRERVAPLQGKLGVAGIGIGVWMIVASILFL